MKIIFVLIAANLLAAPANGVPKSTKTTYKYTGSSAFGSGIGPPEGTVVTQYQVSAFENARKAEPGAPSTESLAFFTYFRLDFGDNFEQESGQASMELSKFKPTLQKGATLSMQGILELEKCIFDFTTGFECSFRNVTFSVDAVWTPTGSSQKGHSHYIKDVIFPGLQYRDIVTTNGWNTQAFLTITGTVDGIPFTTIPPETPNGQITKESNGETRRCFSEVC